MTRPKELNRLIFWGLLVAAINLVAYFFPTTLILTITTVATLFCSYKAMGIKYRI